MYALFLPLTDVVESGAGYLVAVSIALEGALEDFLVVHGPLSNHSRLFAECDGTFGHEDVGLFQQER